jgi:large subunit ribosomal protein L24
MKLRRDDQVMVISGRDRGKTGKISRVLPSQNAVVVDGLNVVKRHTKPSSKQPQGGILEIAKPITIAKLMVIDPVSGAPARVGYRTTKDGTKERVFKPSRYSKPNSKAKTPDKGSQAKTEKSKKTDSKSNEKQA